MTLPPPVTDPASALVERLATLRELELRGAARARRGGGVGIHGRQRQPPVALSLAAWCRARATAAVCRCALSGLSAVEREAPLACRRSKPLADRDLNAADAPRLLPAGTLASDPQLQALGCCARRMAGTGSAASGLRVPRPYAGSTDAAAELAECHALTCRRCRSGRRVSVAAHAQPVILTALEAARAGFVPVRLSVLAPAEGSRRLPSVAAPIDGVIERFLVQPNEAVEAGRCCSSSTTTLRARLEVAEARGSRSRPPSISAVQKAFADAASRAGGKCVRREARRELRLARCCRRAARTQLRQRRAGRRRCLAHRSR